MAKYGLRLTPSAIRSIAWISDRHAWAIIALMRGPLVEAPFRLGKPLQDELQGWYSARCGTYRVLFWVDAPANAVVVERIDHRADIYRPR